MGYQVGVTPLQMATAVSSIANGGMLMRPRLVRAVIRDGVRHAGGARGDPPDDQGGDRGELTTIMEGVVERGTGKPAQIDGYTIAGKTGTAAKLINGEYSKREVLLVVRRVHAVAQAGHRRRRDDGRAERGSLLRRRGRRAGVQAHRRDRDCATWAFRARSILSSRSS